MKLDFLKKYNLINNSLGWFCFIVAAVTYLLTLEPTASFWDCPEFISQGYKLEVGHPPGNPIFMLTARFFITVAGVGPESVAVVVNAMSALLSAATILLMFWTITYLTRLLIIGRKADDALSPVQTIIIMASGICGALMYTWSDTFWFSAVEGEVYAFSSFCTALVFWLILKWDKRADNPSSDRYLILIAYVIGISIAVHLLNLLTIPALALVVYFRKWHNTNVKGSLLALLISFGVVAAILYGLVPGFIGIAQDFELICVNSLGMSYNMGVLIYAVLLVGVLIWCITSLYRQKSLWQIRLSFLLSVILSGMPFIGSSWFAPVVIILGLIIFLYKATNLHFRLLSNIAVSILVIFIGYSSYALLLIRSSADTPMNQNAPDNVFALGSYLNREQYGETPLLYGPQFTSPVEWEIGYVKDRDEYGNEYNRLEQNIRDNGSKPRYAKAVDGTDKYVELPPDPKYVYAYNTLFPRMHSAAHEKSYLSWIGKGDTKELGSNSTVNSYYDKNGNPVGMYYFDGYPLLDSHRQYIFDLPGNPFSPEGTANDTILVFTGDGVAAATAADLYAYGDGLQAVKTDVVPTPSFADNLKYFFTYQLNHMYWRYFMWNFAGRQNDYAGEGESNRGNWISGIPFIDNSRLGDQSLLPDEYGKANKAHNVFYMLPLLMGLIGIAVQLMRGKEGVQQFWIVFFLFFMTGIAIVLYLNQPPMQPRERDYAFAGSFYAFAIWVGIGVYGLWQFVQMALEKADKKKKAATPAAALSSDKSDVAKPAHNADRDRKVLLGSTIFACFIALFVPIQVVSQTWDDHDRSGRYTTRDYGLNYLNSLAENAIIFTNGDNDTFPLWYAQEVLGERTDVRVVNLAYLATDWYANQMRIPSYNAAGIPMQAKPSDYAFDRLQVSRVGNNAMPVTVTDALRDLYAQSAKGGDRSTLNYPSMYIPVDVDKALKAGIITPEQAKNASDKIIVDLSKQSQTTLSNILSLDIINSSIRNGWNRPVYFAMTVPDEYYLNLGPNLVSTGLAYQVTPFNNPEFEGRNKNYAINSDKMYENVTKRFRWGGLDQVKNGRNIYLDETIRRMVNTHRIALLDLAYQLYFEGYQAKTANPDAPSAHKPEERFAKAKDILTIIEEKLPVSVSPFYIDNSVDMANLYFRLALEAQGKEQEKLRKKGISILESELKRYAKYIPFIKDQLRTFGGYSIPLSQVDLYAPHQFNSLVAVYNEIVGFEQLTKFLNSIGIQDVDRFLEDAYDIDIYAPRDQQQPAPAQHMQLDNGAFDVDQTTDETDFTFEDAVDAIVEEQSPLQIG